VLGHFEVTMPEAGVDDIVKHIYRWSCDVVTFEFSHDLSQLVKPEVLFFKSLVLQGSTPNQNPTEKHEHSLFSK
jgi:hypothetical protein